MIRILHFTHIINRYDVVDVVLSRLDRSRFELFVLAGLPGRRTAPYKEGEGYEVRTLGYEFVRRNYARMLSALVVEMRRFRPHILHVHHYDENVVASLAVHVARVPCYIIGRHYSDHVYYLTKGLKRRAVLAVEGWCNRTADFIAVPTDDVAGILTERQGVPPEKVRVLPFGIDFDRYATSTPDAPTRLRREYGLEGKYLIVTCCRLSPEKGLDLLFRAVNEIGYNSEEPRLVVIGAGPAEAELRRLVDQLGIGHLVRFLGLRTDVLDWFATADLMVQPSWCESFCQVLIEALAFATPVVMTPVGVAPWVIGANERGRLVPKGDSRAVADSIVELMRDRELGRQLGAAGQAFIRDRMDAAGAARANEAFYDHALAASRHNKHRPVMTGQV